MTALRREAIGRDCQIRLPGCIGGPCCACHYRMAGISGMGIKSPDVLAAWGCHHCHEIVDRIGRGDPEVQLDFARAVLRTIATLWKEGKLVYTGG